MREVVIVTAVRTPVGKAYKGTLRATRPDDLAAVAIKGALERVPQLDPKEIEDVILGCAMPEAEQGMNVARIASLRAGLPVEISAMTINRFCSSGLQAIAMAAERIMAGGAETIVAGGVESMTMIPMGGHKVSANPWLVPNYPDAYLSMGLTAERVAKRYNITREMQDEFSVAATRRPSPPSRPASSTTRSFPCRSASPRPTAANPSAPTSSSRWTKARAPTPRWKRCCALKPAFHVKGTVTAGNSSQMSDGAAAAVVMSAERAKALGLKPLARYVALCHRRLQAGRDGRRAGVRDSEGAEDGRAQARATST